MKRSESKPSLGLKWLRRLGWRSPLRRCLRLSVPGRGGAAAAAAAGALVEGAATLPPDAGAAAHVTEGEALCGWNPNMTSMSALERSCL